MIKGDIWGNSVEALIPFVTFLDLKGQISCSWIHVSIGATETVLQKQCWRAIFHDKNIRVRVPHLDVIMRTREPAFSHMEDGK